MLRIVNPDDLSFEWERVREGLLVVKQTTSDDWLPEDIYMAIRQGSAALYIGENDQGDYEGFLVLQLQSTFHSKKLLIWCGYAVSKTPIIFRYMKEIKQLAKNAGASKVGIVSNREEWQAVCPRLGFNQAQISYELEI